MLLRIPCIVIYDTSINGQLFNVNRPIESLMPSRTLNQEEKKTYGKIQIETNAFMQ